VRERRVEDDDEDGNEEGEDGNEVEGLRGEEGKMKTAAKWRVYEDKKGR
jgi:hypothetical protein